MLSQGALSEPGKSHKVQEAAKELGMVGESGYYGQDRREMVQFIPDGTSRLIDIGCGEGLFGARVKERFPSCEVWGLEPQADAAARAATRCDRLLHHPLSDTEELPPAYFDVVTMNDVLEHLPYSEPALEIIKRILKPSGMLILSLPNVCYYLTVRDLVFFKDWEYQDQGILDRTHLRFFTQKSALRMLSQNGFAVKAVQGINEAKLSLPYKTLFSLMPRGFTRQMRFPQFAVVAGLTRHSLTMNGHSAPQSA